MTKLDLQWPAALMFTVAFVVIGGLVYTAKIHTEALFALLAWLVPGPTLGAKPEVKP